VKDEPAFAAPLDRGRGLRFTQLVFGRSYPELGLFFLKHCAQTGDRSKQDDLFNETRLAAAALASCNPRQGALKSGTTTGDSSIARNLSAPAVFGPARQRLRSDLSSGQTLKIINARTATRIDADLVLLVPGASEPSKIAEALGLGEGRWIRFVPTDIGALDAVARNAHLDAVTASWQEAFHFRESRPAQNGRAAALGLRRAQIGALKAAPNFVPLLPSIHKQQNPTVISDILADYRALAANTLYVGDSVTRDIAMAAHAGIHSGWAKYGTQFDRKLWDHWTADDVIREGQFRKDAEGVSAA
jgi:hypothetical protein